MVDIRHDGICDAPVSSVFSYLDDYRNAPTWMFGLARFEPRAGAAAQGLGAVFEARFSVTPVKLSTTLEITEWVQDEVIGFRSVDGFTNRSTWRLRDVGDERTEIDVVFTYELPGGLAGRMMGRAFEPVVGLSIRHSDEALRRNVAEFHRRR